MFDEYGDLITVEELCDMLSVGKNTAYTLLNSGAVKAFRIKRVWKIPKKSVVEYVIEKSH
ncbi:helix-turn-helix domain-containing protein, partial [Pectinatus frisingensis]|uniref:helix-turn-helix domain-containing protein n=1 Tax=Pectinatus frisingensis TaxID=865 RepID=UPI0018C5C9F8